MSTKNKQVTTISGKIMSRKKTRRMGPGQYFAIGKRNVKDSGDCIKINDKYYALNKGIVVWNYSKNQYDLKGKLIEGIVLENRELGYFEPSDNNVICHYNGGTIQCCINHIIAEKAGFNENFKNGEYYDTNWKRESIQKIEVPSMRYKESLPYSCNELIPKAKSIYDKKFEIVSKDTLIEELYNKYSHLFEKYSFGIEFETIAGIIPARLFNRLGLIPVRDGSISGIEYVTIPLNGYKGVYTLFEIMRELKKRTKSDISCSMHIHVSGIPRKSEILVSLFKYFFHIQDDMYKYFPMYKKNNMGAKRKNYTAPLSNKVMHSMYEKCTRKEHIDADMARLIYYLSAKHSAFSNLKLEDVKEHPADPNNSRKWNVVTRYVWLNFIPIIFSNKKTIEFRIFTMPNTVLKMMSMLILCLCCIDFCLKNYKGMLKNYSDYEMYDIRHILANYSSTSSIIPRFFRDRRQSLEILQLNKGILIEESEIPEHYDPSLLSNKKSNRREQIVNDGITETFQANFRRAEEVPPVTIEDIDNFLSSTNTETTFTTTARRDELTQQGWADILREMTPPINTDQPPTPNREGMVIRRRARRR